MNLYMISRDVINFDEFDCAVVMAKDEEMARCTDPNTGEQLVPWKKVHGWAKSKDEINVELIGVADESQKENVICISFVPG